MVFERWFVLLGMQLLLWLGRLAHIEPATLEEIRTIRTDMSVNWPKGGGKV